MIDFHMHSTASDGVHSPSDLMKIAADKGADYVALTDHNNINGLEEASVAAKKYNINFRTINSWLHNYKNGKLGTKTGRPKTKNLTLEDYKERYEILKKYQAFLQARREKK